MPYIGRARALELYAAGDPDADESHIFQGDIFHSIEFRVPRLDEAVQGWGVVLSHDCEYTKARTRPAELPLTLAPLRLLAGFPRDQASLIRDNRIRSHFFLPAAGDVDGDYAIDLRLAQPILTLQLADYMYVASMGPELKGALQAKIVEHFTRRILDET